MLSAREKYLTIIFLGGVQVRVWDVSTLKCLSTLTGHSGAVRALAASSKRVFSGSDDTTIKVGPAHLACRWHLIVKVFLYLLTYSCCAGNWHSFLQPDNHVLGFSKALRLSTPKC